LRFAMAFFALFYGVYPAGRVSKQTGGI
jgi:hypothetical protein